MKLKIVISYLFIIYLICSITQNLLCQNVDFGVGLNFVGESNEKNTKKTEISDDSVIKKIAEKFNIENEKLQKFFKQGYGRRELIKLILISNKANVTLDEIIKLRKNNKIYKIALKYNLNYKEILKESEKLFKTVTNKNTQ